MNIRSIDFDSQLLPGVQVGLKLNTCCALLEDIGSRVYDIGCLSLGICDYFRYVSDVSVNRYSSRQSYLSHLMLAMIN